MSTDFHVLEVKDDDVNLNNLNKVWIDEMTETDPDFKEDMDSHYVTSFNKIVSLVVFAGEKPIGFGIFLDSPKDKCVEILELYLIKGFRYKGYGLKLLEKIEKFASDQKYLRVLINLVNFHDYVELILKDIGYQIIPTNEVTLNNDQMVVMEKII